MDVENLAKELILKNMTPEQQMAVLDSVRQSVSQAKEVQKRKIGENVDLVVQALKKIESDIRSRFDDVGNAIEKRVSTIKDGRDGMNGKDGRDGKDGRNGKDGAKGDRGERGQDGVDGINGVDGVSVTNANIDFDGSLIITLSSGIQLNVGEVVAPDLAESIKVITNGGGTSQYVLDTLASLQTQIDNLIPSQTGNAGKFLTTDGTDISWASVAGGLSYQGTWNASTNTPTLTSSVGVNGYYYITDVAGSTNLNGITDWQIGDWLLFNGSVWQKIDQSNLVTSVNGQTGAVSVGTVTSVAATAGTGITVTGSPITSSGTLTITNTAPDQTVALTQAGTTTITGTYPNFTISSADQFQGTVTSVTGTSPVASSGGATPAISLSAGYGDTLNPYASKTANFVLAAPNGSAGVPTFRAVVAGDIPTLNQSTTGSAATLTTPRAIYGNNFDGSAALTQIIASTFGGTGNGFTKFTGATTAEKTYTLPDASSTIVVQGGALGTPSSGTVTNLTGTASININGTVGATTANTGAFTTLSATGVTTVQAGTAALPAITTSGDTNTGIFFPAADTIAFSKGGAEAMRITSAGDVTINSDQISSATSHVASQHAMVLRSATTNQRSVVAVAPNGSGGAGDFCVSSTSDLQTNYNQIRIGSDGTGFFVQSEKGGTETIKSLRFGVAGTALTIDTSNNVGIGTSSPSSYGGSLVVRKANTAQGVTNATAQFSDAVNSALWVGHTSGATNLVADAALTFGYTNGTTTTERMRIDSSGNLSIGTTTASGKFTILDNSGGAGVALPIVVTNGVDANFYLALTGSTATDKRAYIGPSTATALAFQTNNTERMRINSSGDVLVGKTALNSATAGVQLETAGTVGATRTNEILFFANRLTTDGLLFSFRQDSTEEGTISVSGTTVSYNGGHLSRYAQTTTAKDNSLVKGTVLSNLDAMNVYTDAEGNPVNNEQLNKVKVSDVEGDVNVAGVFVNWAHDEAHDVDEINMAMTGDMIIRIAQGTTVVRGDLLMSAGNGTAKPQGDDICRSKTIAKVTSNHVTCTYEDGSYCVPCVLMAC